MKVKLKKSLALLLVITLSLSTSHIASAHTCTFVKARTYYHYTDDKGDVNHSVQETIIYECSCGQLQAVVTNTSASHVFTSYSYSGYNYHSGSIHKFEYARNCILCGHRDAYFQSKSCSGPPCTIPY